jgi:hypothetical protein
MAQGTDFGVHVGWNNAKIDIKDVKVTSNGGFMAGAFLRVDFARLYLEPSLDFVHKKCEASSTSYKETLSYSSVDIPLVLGLYIINARFVKVRGFIGPEVSILTNKLKLKDVEADIKSGRAIWSGKAGGGVDVGSFCLDIDYGFALKDVGGDAKKASALTLTVGFKIF